MQHPRRTFKVGVTTHQISTTSVGMPSAPAATQACMQLPIVVKAADPLLTGAIDSANKHTTNPTPQRAQSC